MNLVSVIMPVWKPRSDWLHESIASVLDEQACDIDLIVVDDGNDAPVSQMLSDVSDPRMRVIRIEHSGPYAARNAGLKAVRGSHVRFFDADDVVVAGSTGRLLAAARAQDAECIAFGWTSICDEDLEPVRLLAEGASGRVAEQFLLGHFDAYISCMLCPRTVIDRVGPWDEAGFTLMGDRDFVQRMFEQAPATVLEEVVTRYRRHEDSITRSSRPRDAVRAGRRVIRRYFDRHPHKRGTALQRAAYRNLHLLRSRQFYRRREIGAALWQLACAFRNDPRTVAALVMETVRTRFAAASG